MLPRDLKPEDFLSYPKEAQAVAIRHLDALRRMPLAFAPSLLREIIDYDYKFPIERSSIEDELSALMVLSDGDVREWFREFAAISLSPGLENFDWVNLPAQFVEQEAAYLWSTHQLDAFRMAAKDYGDRLNRIKRPEPHELRRLGIAVVGRDVGAYSAPLFRNLRKHGTYFSNVSSTGGLRSLLSNVERRAQSHPAPYAHWYVDGGMPEAHSDRITSISFESLAPLRNSLLRRMQEEIAKPGMGPEELRTVLARLNPADLRSDGASDPVLSRFQLKLFTEGSGTQIYSTTFAQWTTREVLRRAQARTLLVRYAPRQRQRPLNELLAGARGEPELDPLGSLMDADMGAYYHWINQQRLPDAEKAGFIAWFEGHNEAVAIGPSMPRGTESGSAIDLEKLISLVSA
jgi:hypothetical protein